MLCPAGVNDDAKRRLLTVAASYLQGAGSGLEDARLSESETCRLASAAAAA